MKSIATIFTFAALSLASCQKEEMLEPTAATQNQQIEHVSVQTPNQNIEASVAQIWVLEDAPYAANISTNALGQQTLLLSSGPKSISGIASSVNYLPAQVMAVFTSLGVTIPPNAIVWQTSTGGFLIEIDEAGSTPTRIFWFNSWYGLRSIGHIQN